MKVDDNGVVLWNKTIGGSGNDELVSVVQTSDGGFLICGNSDSPISGNKTESNLGWFDLWIVKIDGAGNILWDNTIGGAGNDLSSSISQLSNGNYLIGSYSTSGVSGDKTSVNKGSYDYWLMQIDNTGNIINQASIGGSSSDNLVKAAQSKDDNLLLGGYSASGISFDKTQICKGANDYWILKVDTNYNIIWQRTLGGNADDNFVDFIEKQNNEIICGGTSLSNIGGDKTEACFGQEDFWIVGLDQIGNTFHE